MNYENMFGIVTAESINAVEKAADKVESYYLDYFNNFLTVAGYADYHCLTVVEAKNRINAGRKINEKRARIKKEWG